MYGSFSAGGRSYEEFRNSIPEGTRPLYDAVRAYCLDLADNVVEDVRMHRIVFGKSIALRWFADVAPEDDHVVIKIQRGRREPFDTVTVSSMDDLESTKPLLRGAFDAMR